MTIYLTDDEFLTLPDDAGEQELPLGCDYFGAKRNARYLTANSTNSCTGRPDAPIPAAASRQRVAPHEVGPSNIEYMTRVRISF